MKRHLIRLGSGLLVVMASLLLAPLAQAGDTSPPQATVELIVTNAQGTIVAKMTPQGQVTYTAAYRPYGKQAKGAPQSGPGYTGHVNDPASGLIYMQQRYYDPAIGRFISPDPMGLTPGNVFNFNRYAYANNNPIRNIDPTGTTCLRGDRTHCGPQQPHCGARCKQERQKQRENEWVRAFGGDVTVYSRRNYETSSAGAVAVAGTFETAEGVSGLSAASFKLLGVIGAVLSLNGDTPRNPYDYYIHYGYAADKSKFANGLRPGAFATAVGPIMTGTQAEQWLALPPRPTPPDSFYSVRVFRGTVPVVGPSGVSPKYGRPGGGIEYQFPEGTPPGSITGPLPLPRQK